MKCSGIVAAIGGIALWSCSLRAQGLIIPGAGPINRSMAGASTAAPVDFGSSYWNPATISGLDRQEFLLGSELIFPSTHLNTSLPAGAINGQFPTVGRSGTSRSDSGVASNLATGAAFRLDDDSPMTFGLGVFGLVGGSVNYPGGSTPLLTPRNPPQTFGVGPIYANMSSLEITPMASYQVTDKLAVGGGPVITSTSASFTPAFFAPNPKDQFGLASFPAATNGRPFWGGGFQLGLLYELNQEWNVGFSNKSPVWQERWSWNAATPNGTARRISLQAQIPAIYSWGVAYKGLPKTLIDVDLRYFDYANTALFGQSLSSGGLGWQSVFAVATGAQYQLTDRVTLRGGYLFNTNPIRSEGTLFNVQAPGIIEHTLSFGSSMKINDDITLTGAWVHGFRNSISGGVKEIPGGVARFDVQTDSIVVGLNVSFGGKRRKGPAPSPQPMTEPVVETLARAEPVAVDPPPGESEVAKTSATPDPRPVDAPQE